MNGKWIPEQTLKCAKYKRALKLRAQEMYTVDEGKDMQETSKEHDQIAIPQRSNGAEDIMYEGVKAAIKHLKNNKSSGPHKIVTEYIKQEEIN